MAMSQDPTLQAKWKTEWEVAAKRKTMAEAAAPNPAPIMTKKNAELAAARKKIEALERTVGEERRRRKAAEEREAAVRAAHLPASKGDEIILPDLDSILHQVETDLDSLSSNVQFDTAITKDSREHLLGLIQTTANNHFGKVRHGVKYLRHLVDVEVESRDLMEEELLDAHNYTFELMKKPDLTHKEAADAMSTARAAILSITHQLRIFNRQIHIPIKTTTIKSKIKSQTDDTTAVKSENDDSTAASESTILQSVPNFKWEASKLYSKESLGLNDLLEEFQLAAESPVNNLKVLHSLQEQLRVAKASQWKAEKTQDAAQKALDIAQLRLSLLGDPSKTLQELKDQYDNFLAQLVHCRKRGEEMRFEIENLRKLLKAAKNAPRPAPGLSDPEDGEEPFTRQEARALYRLLDDYITHSQQYQQIIEKLEQQMIDLANNTDPSRLSPEQLAILQGSTSSLELLKQQQKQCEREKRHLQDQLNTLINQDDLIKSLRTEITRLKAAAFQSQKAVQNVDLMEDLIAQLESEIVELKAKISQKDEVLGADSDDRTNLLQQQLARAETALATSIAEAGSLRTERDRLAVDKNALDTLATQIIADIAAMPGLQNTPHPTLETAVEYLRERCRFFQADAREERRALGKYVGLVTPAYDALERRIDELNNQWLSAEADVVQCREHAQELQDQLDDQVNQIIRLQTDLKTCFDDKKNVPATARNLAEIHAKERAEFASTRAELEGIKEELDGTETHLRITEKALADCRSGKPDSLGFKQIIKTLKTEREKLLQQIVQLRTDLATAQEETEYQGRRADDLLAQIDEMKMDLDETVQKLKDCEKEKDRTPPRTPPWRSPTGSIISGSSGGGSVGGFGGSGGGTPPSPEPEPEPVAPAPRPRPPRVPSVPIFAPVARPLRRPSPIASEDTPLFTPGGTKRKRAPGSRLRAETRANKKRDIALYKNSIVQALLEPASPPDVHVPITPAKKPAKKPGRKPKKK